MSGFDILVSLNVVVLAAALFMLRPATLTIAANQILALTSLGKVERYGQPRDQGAVPMSVFSDGNLDIARNIFIITSVILFLSLFLPRPRVSSDPRALPSVPKAVVWIILLYFVLATFQGRHDPHQQLHGA